MAELEERTVLRKDQLEISLGNEQLLIKEGTIKDDNPLDLSEPFRELCSACRKGDLKVCQEKITEGVNVNARDAYDYTPLILASLCGHYEVAQLLLESGSLCERDTFQGERCLYNALNDRIRNLLLEYDYSKSTDPLQPLAAHISSLLTRPTPVTSDIEPPQNQQLGSSLAMFPQMHSLQRLDTYIWASPPRELKSGPGTGFTETEVFAAIDKISKYLEIQSLMDSILDSGDRRMARQRRTLELAKGRDQMEEWFRTNVLGNKMVINTSQSSQVKWDRNNTIFADVLLQADELPDEVEEGQAPKSVLFPCHRAMLLRSEFFQTMFSSSFREAQITDHLHIIDVDCAPDVLEIVLTFLYTERADFPLEVAVDVLFAADMLFIEKLKTKAAVVISTLGSGGMSQAEAAKTRGKDDDDIDIYAIMRAAWLTRVQRLEEFAARFLAYRLEAHIDTPEFAELIAESASRIKARQETDSIELLDDIRFYLNERFRLRFDDAGLDEMMDESPKPANGDANGDAPELQDVDKIIDGVEALDVSNGNVNGKEESNHQQPEKIREIRTLDGVMVEDEFDEDAMNYEILMEKLDALLVTLNLDA
ncbi:ankyrin repeat and BTB/POZ domain protein [Penicillium frequentans]|uniref:Ankyrin repeat and BTB/POZ domain protein n=1 Tax=Penicillium frequentans TaxID=3151616 RepID=A0AAD6GJJ9_9EURO|nr:ankyrin repeat and BTB/POZ domain protein [Penicillium glabrum]